MKIKTFSFMGKGNTKSVLNYNSFDFFGPKFDHLSYSKIYAKYHFFLLWFALLTKVLQE